MEKGENLIVGAQKNGRRSPTGEKDFSGKCKVTEKGKKT